MKARLDHIWRTWLLWTVLGVGLALAAWGIFWRPAMWVGWGLVIAAAAVNLGYGVALVRLLVQRRRKRRGVATR